MINKLYKNKRNFSFDLIFKPNSTSSDLLTKSTKEKISKLKLHGNSSDILKPLRSAINIKKHSYNNKINNFYKNHLQLKIKNNLKLQNLLLFEKNKNNRNISSPLSNSNSTRFYSNYSNNSIFKSNISNLKYYKINKSFFRKKTPSNISIKKNNFLNSNQSNLNIINSYISNNKNKLIEHVFDFKNKIKSEIKLSYLLKYKKELIIKYINQRENNVDEYVQNINLLNKTKKYLDIFFRDYSNYTIYLYEIIKKETRINEKLQNKKIVLKNDSEKLKNNQKKLINVLEKLIINKFFLLCVKNNTINIDKFSLKDYNEIKNDRYILNYRINESLGNLNKNNNNILNLKRKKYSSFFQNLITSKRFSTTMKNQNNNNFLSMKTYKPKKNKLIFNSPEEFNLHIKSFEFRISELLNNYNNIQETLKNYKLEYNNLLNDKNLKIISEKLDFEEFSLNQKFNEVKEKNIYLIKNLKHSKENNEKSKKNQKILLNKLIEIYNSLNKFVYIKLNNLYSKKIDINYCFTIEKQINKILLNDNYYKNTFNEEYFILKDKIENENKIKMRKEKIKEKKIELKIKLNNENLKRNKIIFKPLRIQDFKINYIKNYNKNKNKKSNSQNKKKIDIFDFL